MTEAQKDRVSAEKNELDLKLADLIHFIESEGFEGLTELEKSLLRSQRYYMHGYSETLAHRILGFTED